MRVSLLLADYAVVSEGKLHVMGAGWTNIGPNGAPTALALLIEVPWDRTNEPMEMRLELIDDDGRPLIVSTQNGEEPLQIRHRFEAGRPPGVRRGDAIRLPFAFNFPPIPMQPGRGYTWRLWIDDTTDEDWGVSFRTLGG